MGSRELESWGRQCLLECLRVDIWSSWEALVWSWELGFAFRCVLDHVFLMGVMAYNIVTKPKAWSAIPLLERGGWLDIRMVTMASITCLTCHPGALPKISALFVEGKCCPFFRVCCWILLFRSSINGCCFNWVYNYYLKLWRWTLRKNRSIPCLSSSTWVLMPLRKAWRPSCASIFLPSQLWLKITRLEEDLLFLDGPPPRCLRILTNLFVSSTIGVNKKLMESC